MQSVRGSEAVEGEQTPPLSGSQEPAAASGDKDDRRGWSRLMAASSPLRTALTGSLVLIAVLVIVVELVVGFGSTANQRTLLTFLVNLVAVVGLGVFVGNSGILSFAHASFMALGAYCGSILVLTPEFKQEALPDLPGFLASAHLAFLPALAVAALFAGLVALLVGLALSRMAPANFAIATIALLIIITVVLDGAESITRGSATFYGVPPLLKVQGALVIAVLAIVVARVFKESRRGLQLRASREDELASRAIGGAVERDRLVAWVLSACIAGAAGFMLATTLGAFSPKEFSFDKTFLILAMLLIGGMTSVSGAVVGTAVITLAIELLRRGETGVDLGFFATGEIFGLTQLGLGLAILLTLYFRKSGILGYRELDQLRLRRRVQEG